MIKTIDMTNMDYTDYHSNLVQCSECKETTRFLFKNKDIEDWYDKGILPEKIEAFSKLETEDFALFFRGRHEQCWMKEVQNERENLE